MLAAQYRMHARRQFVLTRRRGRRVVSGRVIVYMTKAHSADRTLQWGGPHFGLTVGKSVGNAVVRHRVARQLRVECASWISQLSPDCDVVIAVTRLSGSPSREALKQDLSRALARFPKEFFVDDRTESCHGNFGRPNIESPGVGSSDGTRSDVP